MSLRNRTAFITGASRGIGLEIAKALARRGANVAVAAKSAEPHPKLPGTIHTAVEEIDRIGDETRTGARGLAIQLDVRDERAVEDAVERTASRFGHLDIVVNNASAISLKPTVEATVKSYDLMNNINSRGTWLVSRFALPHLLRSHEARRNPHIVTLSPPLGYSMTSTDPARGAWPRDFAAVGSAYSLAKLGMSVVSLALAAELRGKVGVNAVWPFTYIGTSAMRVVSPGEGEERKWRSPEIVAEAAARVVEEDGSQFTAQWVVDELYLRRRHGFGHDAIARYSLGGESTDMETLAEDLFVSQEMRDEVRRSRRGE